MTETVTEQALSIQPIVDGHNDLPIASKYKRDYSVEGLDTGVPDLHTDIPRLRAGGVGAQFWSLFVPSNTSEAEAVQATFEQIDFVHRLVARYPTAFVLARTSAQVRSAIADGKIASLLGIEGGYSLGSSPAILRIFAELGVRYVTLTHNSNTAWADSGTDNPRHHGLNELGRNFIRELNAAGVLVDLSHTSPETMHAALDVSTAPVIFSHSGVRGVTDHPRNVPDDVLRRLPGNGGVLMLTFVPTFVSAEYARWFDGGREGTSPPAGITEVADHIEYARKVVGIDHIGLGGDYDGYPALADGLEDVSGYPRLLDELVRRGWTLDELVKLNGANILRVLDAADASVRQWDGASRTSGKAVY
ncbi:dipeptidase [Rhodococcus sp. NPDC059969]|uniref:dipeptidase n=1 Tax=Rhodococcus sp. NPDC059969 TaxID=3347018 RepID=UPI00367186E6